jgi:hypothetical protein
MKIDVKFSTDNKTITPGFSQKSQSIEPNFPVSTNRGATFYPDVSESGMLSWTNDGELKNPDPVNIRGPIGPQGIPGTATRTRINPITNMWEYCFVSGTEEPKEEDWITSDIRALGETGPQGP